MSRGKGYGYAVARIRAMESLLLDAEIFRRMLDAADLAGALKVLGETVYGRSLADSGAGERCDAALEAELLSTYLELRSFVPKKELVDLCRLQYDFHNVKVLIKSAVCSKSGGKKRWDLLTDLGTIPGDTLIASVESEEYRFLPYGLSALIPDCFALWEKTGDMVEVERIADGALFAQMLKTAADLGEPGALKWVKARVDSENIRNLLRLKRFGFEPQSALAFLHSGGTLPAEALARMLPEPFDSWSREMGHSGVGEALSGLHEEGGFDALTASLEKALDDYCRDILFHARYSINAPENVLAYIWGKEMEVRNIRTVLVSKSAGSDKDAAGRMLRHGY